MNNISISRVIVTLLGLLFGMYVIMEALTSNTSILGRLYLFVAISALLIGLLKPRAAVYAMIFCTAYIDFFKRLVIVAGTPTNFDVACTLATPPLLCAGAVINIILSTVMGKFRISKGLVWSFIFATSLLLIGLITSSGGGVRGFGGVVNFVAYPFLLVIIPAFFPRSEDKKKLMKFIYIIFLVVAVYMIKHGLFGLADFEYEYLLTNLSQEVRILWEGENSRYFSTMNSAAIVSTMCAIMFFWSIANVWGKTFMHKTMRLFSALIFVVACYFTLSRTGWFCGLIACICYMFFRHWKTTLIAYAAGICIVISLVVFSPIIKDTRIVERIELELKSLISQENSRAEQATTIGSVNGRINGWVNLMTKGHIWTPLGWKFAGKKYEEYNMMDMGDDIIFWSIVRYGYVSVFIGGFVFLIFLYKLHWFVCQLPRDSLDHKIANICLATSIGIISGGLSNAAQLYVFPINVYFYLCLSFVFSIYLNYRQNLGIAKYYDSPKYLKFMHTKVA
jgi:hypothetical protein